MFDIQAACLDVIGVTDEHVSISLTHKHTQENRRGENGESCEEIKTEIIRHLNYRSLIICFHTFLN